MDDVLQAVLTEARQTLPTVPNRPAWEAAKARLVGPNGSLTGVMKQMGKVPKEDRPAFGRKLNEAKQAIEALLAVALERVENEELAARLGTPADPTLPPPAPRQGSLHVLTQTRERMVEIFRRAGFAVAEGPEVETEWFCFDALNTPPEHPARDLQDTFYLPTGRAVANVSQRESERYMLRTHTSSVQIRTMLARKPPIRIVSPGRVYRRDAVDATHSANFHQMEGLFVDKLVTIRDLKAILDYFFQALLGPGTETRFRPHFFPYTEPSFEVDIRLPDFGKLSGRWIEVMGCGMVSPHVFEAVGYGPDEVTGYAFGMGIERLAMFLYGIDDIRHFYANDLRFLAQFA